MKKRKKLAILKKQEKEKPKQIFKVGYLNLSWKEFLEKYNNGSSTILFGIVVDWDGNPITGRE